LIVPSIEKVYIVNNGCADAITVKNSGGTGIAVPAGKTMFVYNNGTNVVDATTHLSSLTTGTLGATGVATFSTGSVSAPAITTAGDTNTGIFFPAADTIAFTEGGTEAMRIDSSGNVGIGTSSANKSSSSTALTVNTGTAANYSAVEWASGNTLNYHINANDSAIYHVAAGTRPWIVYTNGSERMRITSDGNVGIGTSSPTNFGSNFKMLAVQGSDYGVIQAISSSGSTTLEMMGSSGIGYVGTRTNHPVAFRTNDTERMRIDSSGNVGIGTSSPATKLDVSGNLRFSAANPVIELNNGGPQVYSTAANTLQFATGGGIGTATERMRIDSSGNLLVGTTSSIGGLLQVNQTANSSGANFQCTNASFTAQVVQAITTKAAGTDFTLFRGVVNNAGTVVVNIFGNGNITNTNNSYGAISDIKLKENIVDATPKLEDLCKVKIRQYNLKSNPNHKQIGVVAQELEEVFAGLVDEIADKDTNGKDLGTTTKQVKYSVFVPMLIKAIQEQQAIITDLKARVETLESK
jgi:hypothetical protein